MGELKSGPYANVILLLQATATMSYNKDYRRECLAAVARLGRGPAIIWLWPTFLGGILIGLLIAGVILQ
jgi:hypothetical protein